MTGLIILAAGESSRLGKPKQNLLFNGRTLLQNAIATGLIAECRPILVVLGANADLIERWPHHANVNYVYNANWQLGMASSITAAMAELEKYNTLSQVIIMVCDQPFVTPMLIDQLILKQQDTGKPIIACAYNDTFGVPALFTRQVFKELFSLNGHEGAKKIISQYPEDRTIINFKQGVVDIDTEDDYNQLTD